MQYAVCSMQYAVCSMQYAVCSMQNAVCSMQYAVCSMQYAVCSMQYAECSMQYAVCSMHTDIFVRPQSYIAADRQHGLVKELFSKGIFLVLTSKQCCTPTCVYVCVEHYSLP